MEAIEQIAMSYSRVIEIDNVFKGTLYTNQKMYGGLDFHEKAKLNKKLKFERKY
jgi:hypothetical protein